MNPRYGEPVRPHLPYRTRPGAYVIAQRHGHVLLTWQAQPLHGFQLPGGGLEPHEGPLGAARREVLEETGWRIAGLRKLGVFRRFTEMTGHGHWAEKVCHVYLADAVRHIAAPSEPEHEARLVPLDRAFDLLSEPGEAEILAHALLGGAAMRQPRQAGPK